MLAQRRRQWPSITSALGLCMVLISGVSGAGIKASPACRKHDAIAQCCFNFGPASKTVKLSTLKQHWVNATCLRKVHSRPSDRLVLGQRHRRLTGIEPAMGCDAGPTLNRNVVGRPTSSVRA